MTEQELKQQQLIQLKQVLNSWFSQEELEDLSFDLGLDFLALGGSTKEANVRQLLMLLSRRGRLADLLDYCEDIRPEIEWGLFAQLQISEPEPVQAAGVASPVKEPVRDKGFSFLLSLVGVLFVVILIRGAAGAYYLTRTSTPVSAEPNLIIQVPARETIAREQIGRAHV